MTRRLTIGQLHGNVRQVSKSMLEGLVKVQEDCEKDGNNGWNVLCLHVTLIRGGC